MPGAEGPSREGRPRRRRLSRSAEFERVYRESRSHGNRYLVLYAFPRSDADGMRLGLTVPRQVGGAVQRNLVKRLLREAMDELGDAVPASYDVVVKARPPALELAERDGLAGVREALDELLSTAALGA